MHEGVHFRLLYAPVRARHCPGRGAEDCSERRASSARALGAMTKPIVSVSFDSSDESEDQLRLTDLAFRLLSAKRPADVAPPSERWGDASVGGASVGATKRRRKQPRFAECLCERESISSGSDAEESIRSRFKALHREALVASASQPAPSTVERLCAGVARMAVVSPAEQLVSTTHAMGGLRLADGFACRKCEYVFSLKKTRDMHSKRCRV